MPPPPSPTSLTTPTPTRSHLGCSSVNCVCGTNFNWVDELGKFKKRIRSERSGLFRRRHPHWPAEAAVVLSRSPPGTEDRLLANAYTEVESVAVQAAHNRATVAKAHAWTAQHGARAAAVALDCLGDTATARAAQVLSTTMPSEQADRLRAWLAADDGANKLVLEAEIEARERRFADTWNMLQARQPICAPMPVQGSANSSCSGWGAAVALAWPCLLPSPSSAQFVSAWAVVNADELQQTQAQLWVLLHAHNVPRAAAAANVILGCNLFTGESQEDEDVIYYTAKRGWERKKLHVRVPSQVKRVSKRAGAPMPPPSRQVLAVLSKAWCGQNPDAAHLAKMHGAWFAEHDGLGAVARATTSGTWIKSKQVQQAAEEPDALIPPPPATVSEMTAWYEKTFKTNAYNICMRSRAAAGLETAPALPHDWRATVTASGPSPSPRHVVGRAPAPASAPAPSTSTSTTPSPRATTNATATSGASVGSLLEQIRLHGGGDTQSGLNRGGRYSGRGRTSAADTATGPSLLVQIRETHRRSMIGGGRRRRAVRLGGGSGGGSGGGGGGSVLQELMSVGLDQHPLPYQQQHQQQHQQHQQQHQQHQQILVEAEQPDWSCSACTFLNPMSGSRCEMCNTARLLETSNTPVQSPSLTPGPDQVTPSLPPPPNGAGGGHTLLNAIQAGFALRSHARSHDLRPGPTPTLTSTLTPPTGGLPAPLSLSSAADEDDLLDQPDPVWDTPMDRGNAELLDALRQRRQRIANDDAPPTPPPTAPMLHRHPLMFGGLSRSRTPETNPSDDLFDSDSDSEDW